MRAKICPMFARILSFIYPKIARFLIFSYPTLVYLAFFSWLRLTLFDNAWTYFSLIPLFFALEIWLSLKRSNDKKISQKELVKILIRSALLALPMFIIVLSIYDQNYSPIKVHYFFELGKQSLSSSSSFALLIFITLAINYIIYIIVKRLQPLFSLYLPMSVFLLVIALANLFGTKPTNIKYEMIFRRSEIRSVCPALGPTEQFALISSNATDFHHDGNFLYISYKSPFVFRNIQQISMVKVGEKTKQLACLYASGVNSLFSDPLFSYVYYTTSTPKTTFSAIDKLTNEAILLADRAFAPLSASPARREFTDVFVDSAERFAYVSLGINPGILKVVPKNADGEFLNLVDLGFAWNGSSIEKIIPWQDERYIYAITRYAPASLIQIQTSPLKITNFYIENSIKSWKYHISDVAIDSRSKIIYCFIPLRSEVLALSHPSLKVLWKAKTPEPIKLVEKISNRYFSALSYEGKLYIFDSKLRKFNALAEGIRSTGAIKFAHGKLLIATSRRLLSLELPTYLITGQDAPKQLPSAKVK